MTLQQYRHTHTHIFSLPRIRLRLILIMKCILWALTVSYNERECSSNASATKIKGETFKMHLILKVLLSISRRKVQCKINWKTSLSKSFHIYFLEDHHYLIFALCWREKIECLQDRNQHRGGWPVVLQTKAIRRFVITEKAPTRAFTCLKVATTALTFKTLLRHSLC